MTPNYIQRLQRLAFNTPSATEEDVNPPVDLACIDAKALSLARLAALVAIGAAEPSFGEHADAAVSAGVSPDEMVDVLIGISAIVGVPRVVEAAPKLALALGHDVDDLVG